MKSFTGKKIVVLGAGISGLEAAILLKKWGARVFVSEKGKLSPKKRQLLENYQISYEESGHSSRIFNSDLLVPSPGISPNLPFMQKTRELKIPVLSELEIGWLNLMETNLRKKVLAITGTNGKTTVVSWVHHITKELGGIACGNVGLPVTSLRTTDKGPFILEVSSFQLYFTKRFRPDVALILNISQDHFDWHGSFDEYVKAKSKIFQHQTERDWLILNADDPNVMGLSDFRSKPIFFSLKREVRGAYLRGEYLFINIERPLPVVRTKELPTRGSHNLENALATILASYLAGANIDRIKEGLLTFSPLPHRLEWVGRIGEVDIYNDSKATNPHAVLAALNTFNERIVLILGGQSKGIDPKELVRKASRKAKRIVVFGEMKDLLLENLPETLGVSFADSIEEALHKALDLIDKGVILFSPGGASFDQFKNYAERGEKFKDAVKRAKTRKFRV